MDAWFVRINACTHKTLKVRPADRLCEERLAPLPEAMPRTARRFSIRLLPDPREAGPQKPRRMVRTPARCKACRARGERASIDELTPLELHVALTVAARPRRAGSVSRMTAGSADVIESTEQQSAMRRGG
jgi:hypothetical protein